MKKIKLFLGILGILLEVIPCLAQDRTKKEQEWIGRLHWNRMLNLMNISLPDTLPPPAEDPDRSAGTFQKEGSSGKGGATLYRRNYGETIGILSSSGEFHWFAGNFLKYEGPLNAGDLKVDTHELIVLCAPRPIFISTGSPKVEGRWLDNKGQYLAARHAGPVYELLGQKGVGSDTMPDIGVGLMEGDIAFRQHEGGHTDAPNWPYFLEFATRYLSD